MSTPRATRTITGRVIDLTITQLERPPVMRARRRAAARLRDLSNRLEGLAYRVADRHPDPHADDTVLTQRIRSRIGPLERRLDVPRLNVTVHDHIAELRGVVGTRQQAEALIDAVAEISGVTGVLSYLHIGYGPGDTLPSEGRSQPVTSDAWRDLVASVREVGQGGHTADCLVTSSLVTLFDVLPDGERDHVRSHLPQDVRDHLDALVRVGQPPRPRTTEQFVAAVTATCPVPQDTAELAVRRILATLQDLVPEETADIQAVLPGDLKELWRTPLATASPA